MRIKLHQLNILREVAVQGSFGKAAKSLGLTQPAISKTISDIEEEIGLPILLRHSRGIELNEYGQVLIRHARDIDQSLHQAREDIDKLLGNAMRQLRVGFTSATSCGPLASSLLAFQQQCPNVKIITQQNRPHLLQRKILQKELDIALISSSDSFIEEGLDNELLYSLGNFIIGAKDHPVQHRTSLKKLLSFPWIDWDEPQQPSLLSQLCTRYNLPLPQNIIHCSSPEIMQYFLVNSPMLSIWSTAGLPLLSQNPQLRKIILNEALPLTQVSIISATLARNSTATNQFIDILRHHTQRWLQQEGSEQFLAHHP